MRIAGVCSFVVGVLLSLAARGTAQQVLELSVKPLENREIVADGRHNAFASLAHWRGRYWLAFR